MKTAAITLFILQIIVSVFGIYVLISGSKSDSKLDIYDCSDMD